MSAIGRVNISVYTNGFTKILKIIDQENEWRELEQLGRSENRGYNLFNYNLPSQLKKFEENIVSKLVEINLRSICLSFIYRKNELMTLYIQDVAVNLEDTEFKSNIKFNIGYMQIDNQSELQPAMAVIIRPRDLFH